MQRTHPPLVRAVLVLLGTLAVAVAQTPTPTTPAPTSRAPSFTPVERLGEGAFGKATRAAGRDLTLQGVGLCEWGIFGIDLYHAALYCERRMATPEQAVTADQVLVIHLDFARKLTGDQLRAAFAASAKANAGDNLPHYTTSLDALGAALSDVVRGDSYTFVLAPGRGIDVHRNGEHVAAIADESFRVLFQRLFLGERPPTAALRLGMLGWER